MLVYARMEMHQVSTLLVTAPKRSVQDLSLWQFDGLPRGHGQVRCLPDGALEHHRRKLLGHLLVLFANSVFFWTQGQQKRFSQFANKLGWDLSHFFISLIFPSRSCFFFFFSARSIRTPTTFQRSRGLKRHSLLCVLAGKTPQAVLCFKMVGAFSVFLLLEMFYSITFALSRAFHLSPAECIFTMEGRFEERAPTPNHTQIYDMFRCSLPPPEPSFFLACSAWKLSMVSNFYV